VKSLRGQFLIASAKLRDPNFFETVVLMVRHDEEGALGLVLNRPLDVTVQEACGNASISMTSELPLYRGGPCDGPLMVLHNADVKSEQVIPGVRFATEAGQILEVLENQCKAKCFAGYAGWSPGQLEAEMESQAWMVVKATAGQVFDTESDLYRKLLTTVTLSPWVDPSRIPEDPNLN
jgi:putative transcriptional regulator